MTATNKNPTYALALLLAVNTLNFYDRHIPSIVAEPMRIALNLEDSGLGWIQTAFILLYAIVGLPLGKLADSRSRVVLLSVGVGVWTIFTSASSLAVGFWSLFFIRMGVGVGEATCSPAASSLLGDLFEPRNRARVFSIFMLGLPIGIGLSSFASGWIAGRDPVMGWRYAFLVPVLPGLLLTYLLLTISEPSRQGGAPSEAKFTFRKTSHEIWLAVVEILRSPTMRWIILTGALLNFCMYAMTGFLSPLLQRYHGMDVQDAGRVQGIVSGFCGGMGLFVGGWLGDRLAHKRTAGRLELACLAVVIGTVGQVAALMQPQGQAFIFAACLLGSSFLMYFYYGCVYASIQDVVRPQLRGTAMGLYFLAMYFLGGAFGPALTGWLSDRFRRAAALALDISERDPKALAIGLHQAMWIVPILGLPLAFCLYMASLRLRKERKPN